MLLCHVIGIVSFDHLVKGGVCQCKVTFFPFIIKKYHIGAPLEIRKYSVFHKIYPLGSTSGEFA